MGELSRVTVVGNRKRVDVALPTSTPVGEYVPRLARMCGQDRDPMLPPAWSLAVAGAPPMPLSGSLADLGVLDGQVLYLRDAAREPGSAPMVEDIDELVADETVEIRRRMVRSGPVITILGLLWTVAAALWLALKAPGAQAAIGLAIAGPMLIGTAWALGQRSNALSRALRLGIALTSVPVLAVAGQLVGVILGGSAGRWAGLLVGANLAALMALAAIASPVLAVVSVDLAAGAVVLSLIGYAGATPVQGAATATLAALGLVGVGRRVAASMAAWGTGSMRTRHAAAAGTVEMVHESGRILALVLLFPAAVLTVSLPMLALSGNVFAVGLAMIVATALLTRARLAGFTTELVILAVAGLVGMFAATVAVARFIVASDAVQTALFLGIALAVLSIGVALSLYGPIDPTTPSPNKAPRRRTRAEVLGAMCSVAATPLAMGVFGVFGRLIGIGRHLF